MGKPEVERKAKLYSTTAIASCSRPQNVCTSATTSGQTKDVLLRHGSEYISDPDSVSG